MYPQNTMDKGLPLPSKLHAAQEKELLKDGIYKGVWKHQNCICSLTEVRILWKNFKNLQVYTLPDYYS